MRFNYYAHTSLGGTSDYLSHRVLSFGVEVDFRLFEKDNLRWACCMQSYNDWQDL